MKEHKKEHIKRGGEQEAGGKRWRRVSHKYQRIIPIYYNKGLIFIVSAMMPLNSTKKLKQKVQRGKKNKRLNDQTGCKQAKKSAR